MSMPPDHSHSADSAEPAEAAAFTTALQRTADSLPSADGLALVSAGYARGRKLRRRRTAGVTAAAAVVAFAGVGGLLAAGAGHDAAPGGTGTGVAAAPQLSGGTLTPEVPTAMPTSAVPASMSQDAPQVSARQMEDLLVSLLPHGKISGRDGRGTDNPLGSYAHVVFDDGHGRSAIEIMIQNTDQGASNCDNLPANTESCTITHTHGGTLTLFKGYEYPDGHVDTKWWLADFVTADGSLVSVSEWNAAAEKLSPVTRPKPPLSANQLTAIVTSDTWNQALGILSPTT